MSGRKVSVYEMSAQQRQNLRAQLNCLRQSVICREEIKKSVDCLNGLQEPLQSLLSIFDLINRRTKDCSGEIAVLHDLRDLLLQESRSFMEQLPPYAANLPADRLTLTEDALDKKKEMLAKLQSLRNSAVARRKSVEETLKPLEEKAQRGVSKVNSALAEDIAGVQSFFIPPAESAEEKFAAEKKSLAERLRILSLSDDCPAGLKGEVVSVTAALSRVASKEQLGNFKAVTIQPLLQKIENARKQALEEKSELESLQSRYSALCSVIGLQPEVFSPAEGAAAKIRDKIAILEKQVVRQTEQEYISDRVNEVMSEMGYDVIGSRSVTKRSGKRFRNELFSYGDGAAINVTYDSDGQIAMELGGIDGTDRVPTAEEAAVLREDMESFCSDFKDFEERLKAKGIMVKSRISMAPPTAEYATIINVSDYTVTAANPIKEIAVRGTRVKTAAKRALRREDY
jgi:hypothetical protein